MKAILTMSAAIWMVGALLGAVTGLPISLAVWFPIAVVTFALWGKVAVDTLIRERRPLVLMPRRRAPVRLIG